MPGTLAAQVCFRGVSELILEVIEGPDAGKRVVVDRPIVVGRDPRAGFVLQDREVSRRHLQLTPTGDYVTVEDLGSANGTFVNRNELHGPARLDAGDELLAGVTVMQLRDRQQVEAKHSAVIAVPQGLAMAPRTPAYADPQKVTADVHAEQRSIPEYPLAFGVAFNPDPTKKFVYVDAAVASRVAVYNYSNPAALQLASNAINPGLAACWIVVSKDGRFLYDSNSATQNISVFSISPDGSTLKLVGTVPVKSKGTTDSLALDPSGKWLYILGNHDDADAPRPEGSPLAANYLDAYKIDPATGKLSEIATVKLPVPVTNVPYGIDVLPKS